MSQFDVRSFKDLCPREAHLCLDLLNAMGRGDSVQRIWQGATSRRFNGTRQGTISPLTQAQIDLALGLAIQCFAPNTVPRLAGLIRKFTNRPTANLADLRVDEYRRLLGSLRGSLGLAGPPPRTRRRSSNGSLTCDRKNRSRQREAVHILFRFRKDEGEAMS